MNNNNFDEHLSPDAHKAKAKKNFNCTTGKTQKETLSEARFGSFNDDIRSVAMHSMQVTSTGEPLVRPF